MWKPSINPITPNFKPADYYKLGSESKPGDPKKIMSRTELFAFGECPSRWFHGIENKETDAMKFGSVLDCMVMTPKLFDENYVVAPAVYPCDPKRNKGATEKPWNANANYCKDWVEVKESDGLTVITAKMHEKAKAAVIRLDAHHKAPGIMKQCQSSVLLRVEWHDEDTGLVIPFKCLLDLLPDPKAGVGDTIFDFKTTADASSKKWVRRVFDEGYHYQAAVYVDAANAATGAKYKQFSHIIQENSAPYEPTVSALSSEFLSFGRGQYTGDLKQYCRSLRDNRWPGLDEAVVEPETWMTKEL